MPQAKLSRSLLTQLLKKELTTELMAKALLRTKAELKELDGESLMVETTADRLDLLSESGFAMALEGLFGTARGMHYHPNNQRQGSLGARIDPAVAPLRGELAMAVARAPRGLSLDEELMGELIRFQELLHATLGRDRRNASLGLYPLDRLKTPFLYTIEPLEGIRFTPLSPDGKKASEWGGTDFYENHPMARAYGTMGRAGCRALTIRDANGALLSLPPVLNAATEGELTPGKTEVLIESTGTLGIACRQMVGYMLLPFVARGWIISPLSIEQKGKIDDGSSVISVRRLSLEEKLVREVLGLSLTGEEVRERLLEMRLDVDEGTGGWEVRVPPWRPDILGSVDLVEEVGIARGLASIPPELAAPSTRGRRLPFTRFSLRFLEVMVGMGYQEVRTPLLVTRELSERLSPTSLPLTNPVSQEFAFARSSLLPGLISALSHNTNKSYPQRLFEVGEVIVPDGKEETGAATKRHLALVDAGTSAGFARAAAVAERLARVTGILPVRGSGEALGAIPGRVARLIFAGEPIALLGEVHPMILTEVKIPEPVSWVEVDLSLLWTLKGGGSPGMVDEGAASSSV